MRTLKAHVHNGRLVLDEPTDLPEGEVVYLQPVDDDMSDDAREALHDSIRESIEQMKTVQPKTTPGRSTEPRGQLT